MKKIAIIGTQGVPAKYGGFETLVENIIGENCSPDIQYTVFCSSKDYHQQTKSYQGAPLKYIPLHANGIQSIPYDILSLLQVIRGYDTIVILGVSGCIFLPIFRLLCSKHLVINIDGLEHKRAKWGKFASRFLKLSEALAVRFADVIIADNKGIQDYIKKTYKKEAKLIAYGGDHVLQDIPKEEQVKILADLQLEPGEYGVTVCRIEPENNCHLILETFAKKGQPLAFIGNWDSSEYGIKLKNKYNKYPNIHIIGPIYNLKILYVLRKNCKYYLHGHSAGGTNPSLVEAMFFQIPVFAYDVIYNRHTTLSKGHYFKDCDSLGLLLNQNIEFLKKNAKVMYDIALTNYTWKKIAHQYEECYP